MGYYARARNVDTMIVKEQVMEDGNVELVISLKIPPNCNAASFEAKIRAAKLSATRELSPLLQEFAGRIRLFGQNNFFYPGLFAFGHLTAVNEFAAAVKTQISNELVQSVTLTHEPTHR